MSKRTWQPLIEGMIEAVWIVDALELRVLAVNRVAAELLGVSADNLIVVASTKRSAPRALRATRGCSRSRSWPNTASPDPSTASWPPT